MINKKIIVIILIFLSALSVWIYVSIHGTKRNGDIFTSTPSPTAIPTPTPIILDLKNRLSKEVGKLTPEDFSSDFETLKKSF